VAAVPAFEHRPTSDAPARRESSRLVPTLSGWTIGLWNCPATTLPHCRRRRTSTSWKLDRTTSSPQNERCLSRLPNRPGPVCRPAKQKRSSDNSNVRIGPVDACLWVARRFRSVAECRCLTSHSPSADPAVS